MSEPPDGTTFTIAHLSDLHCGGQYFVPGLLERAISEINDLKPDIVVCSGDLTTFGFKHEYEEARRYLDKVECEAMVVIPGNHDSRNVGYVHFEELFGDRNSVLRVGPATVVAVDSTEPDLDHGQIGRGRYRWIEEQFARTTAELRVFVCHHHLLPVPGTGRERNVIYDAGDTIECLQRAGVHLVLSGHKHVPYAWKLENLFVVNTGTVSSLRLRGNTRPCYNVVEVSGSHVAVWRKHPFHGQERIIQFSTRHLRVREVHGADRGRGDDPLVTRRLALIDGEHYAPVVRAALRSCRTTSSRRTSSAAPRSCVATPTTASASRRSRRGPGRAPPELVVDLSDEPVLGPRERFRLASRVLAAGLPYVGADFRFDPPALEPFPLPSIGIVGTGKRVGKTAITAHAARLYARDRKVVVVAMGRGGPPEPEVARVRPTSTSCSSSRARGGTRRPTTSRPPRSPA